MNQEKKLCIGFTQENSIKNLVEDYLPYILKSHGPYSTTSVYSK